MVSLESISFAHPTVPFRDSDSLRSLLSVLPSQASLGQKGSPICAANVGRLQLELIMENENEILDIGARRSSG